MTLSITTGAELFCVVINYELQLFIQSFEEYLLQFRELDD